MQLKWQPAVCVSILLLTGCSMSPSEPTYAVQKSKIAAGEYQAPDSNDLSDNQQLAKSRFTPLSPLSDKNASLANKKTEVDKFSVTKQVSFASEAMPLKQFIEVLFSELLNVSYVVAQNVPGLEEPVTLNVGAPVSQQQAFLLAAELLKGKGIDIQEKDGVFYLMGMMPGAQKSIPLGYGRSAAEVPATADVVTQVVPLNFSAAGIENSIQQFVRVNVTRNQEQNLLIMTGLRNDVIRALDVVKLLDSPSARGKHISMLRLTYLGPDEFIEKLSTLLQGEGIDGGLLSPQAAPKNLVMVPISHMGAVVVFAAQQDLLDRVNFWAEQIDVPSEGADKRYFVYHPGYARAADLGTSIAPLIGGNVQGGGDQSRDTNSAMQSQNQQNQPNQQSGGTGSRRMEKSSAAGPVSVQNENLTMTVDDRSNSIIFFATGSDYQTILPMLKRLDVMPKQVLLEATIAEVVLTDGFAMGVEFAIKNGKFGMGTSGGLGVGTIGGLNLGYLNGADSILARMEESSQLVNVLSNPSVVVRDGVVASIMVGNEIPSVSSSTTDPLLSDKVTTTIAYKQTGLEFSVLPTINGQGLVVMQIQQSISNQADGSGISGAPAIFKRTLETEVIAHSGQTILLAGLISENDDSTDTKVPFFADLPLIGNLFKKRNGKRVKTELVLLITPRVIDAAEQWHYINAQMQKGFNHLQIND